MKTNSYRLSGVTPLGICYTQNLHAVLKAFLLILILALLRFTSLKMAQSRSRGEMLMSIYLFLSSLAETFWAMIISYAVGTSMSPRICKYGARENISNMLVFQ